jgi:hypothetical protein
MVYQLNIKIKLICNTSRDSQNTSKDNKKLSRTTAILQEEILTSQAANSSNHSNISCSCSELSQHIWIKIGKHWTCVLKIKAGLTVLPSYLSQMQDAIKVKENRDALTNAETNHNLCM